MKILGIDPGLGIVGYSIVDYDGEKSFLLHSGSIQTEKGARESSRLVEIFEDMTTNLTVRLLKNFFSLETERL